jgi:hypothetical protein
MADQIEATVARATVGSEDPEERVFMDFSFTTKDGSDSAFLIAPFPFQGELVRLAIEYALLAPPSDMLVAVRSAKPDERTIPLRKTQTWLEDTLQRASFMTKEIQLWPWI